MEKFHPDLLFTVNHLYIDTKVISLLWKKRVPLVSWFFDASYLRYIIKNGLSLYEKKLSLFFIWDKSWVGKIKEIGIDAFHLPFATDPDVFTIQDIDGYVCDVSFAGISMFQHYRNYCCWSPELRELVELQVENPLLYMEDIRDTFYKVEEIRKMEIQQLEEAAASLYRKRMIEALSGYKIYVYGDEGWKSLLDKDKGVHFMGTINDRKLLSLLYNRSRINLNLTKPQSKSGLNMRVFDILGAGGFLLSDYRREMVELFELGSEVVCFRSKSELLELVSYYLDRPKERDRVRMKGRERVIREHKYEDRIEVIERIFLERFG
jgi:spore maturation protein CgeB